MTRTARLLIVGASLGALSACGLQGDLRRPDPLWGNPADRPPAEAPDRTVDSAREGQIDELTLPDDADETPDAEDELLGGPGGGE